MDETDWDEMEWDRMGLCEALYWLNVRLNGRAYADQCVREHRRERWLSLGMMTFMVAMAAAGSYWR